MTFIDWSNPEELCNLLVEFIADESNETQEDESRLRFLCQLQNQIKRITEQFPRLDLATTIALLQRAYDSIDSEFENDSVVTHVSACIEELQRISNGAA